MMFFKFSMSLKVEALARNFTSFFFNAKNCDFHNAFCDSIILTSKYQCEIESYQSIIHRFFVDFQRIVSFRWFHWCHRQMLIDPWRVCQYKSTSQYKIHKINSPLARSLIRSSIAIWALYSIRVVSLYQMGHFGMIDIFLKSFNSILFNMEFSCIHSILNRNFRWIRKY